MGVPGGAGSDAGLIESDGRNGLCGFHDGVDEPFVVLIAEEPFEGVVECPADVEGVGEVAVGAWSEDLAEVVSAVAEGVPVVALVVAADGLLGASHEVGEVVVHEALHGFEDGVGGLDVERPARRAPEPFFEGVLERVLLLDGVGVVGHRSGIALVGLAWGPSEEPSTRMGGGLRRVLLGVARVVSPWTTLLMPTSPPPLAFRY